MGIFLMAALAYAATNTDDIFIVSLLFADAVSTRDRLCITAGRLAGILALTSVSILGAGGIRAVAGRWAHLLGIVPLILGVKAVSDCTAGNINKDTGTAIRNSIFICLLIGYMLTQSCQLRKIHHVYWTFQWIKST